MLTEAVRRRIESLNRAPLVGLPMAPPARPRRERGPTVVLGAARHLLETGEVIGNASGEHLRVRVPLSRFWPNGTQAVERRLEKMAAMSARSQAKALEAHPELAALARAFPEEAMFLDLETCGFAGSMVFLVGLLRQIDGRLIVELLLARHYAEERAMLETLWRVAAEHRVLVTFNGKSFDWPMVNDRSTLHHLGRVRCVERGKKKKLQLAGPAPRDRVERDGAGQRGALGRHDVRPELVHCDLLHHARRSWKHRLPNCRLQTLERYVCGRRREGDIPGSMIPATYHHYVRSGETTEMESVLSHNAIDLVTLLDLALRLAV